MSFRGRGAASIDGSPTRAAAINDNFIGSRRMPNHDAFTPCGVEGNSRRRLFPWRIKIGVSACRSRIGFSDGPHGLEKPLQLFTVESTLGAAAA